MLQQPIRFTDTQLSAWDDLITKAAENSIQALADMSGQDVKSDLVKPYKIDCTDIPNVLGGADKVAVGVLLGIEQVPAFHIALLHTPETAYQVVDILLGESIGTTHGLGEMEISALGEMGNIMGGYFLNTVGDESGYQLKPTPPSVRMDMTGAILDYAIASLMMETDEVTMIEANYGTAEKMVDGVFAVMPSPELQGTIMDVWGIK